MCADIATSIQSETESLMSYRNNFTFFRTLHGIVGCYISSIVLDNPENSRIFKLRQGAAINESVCGSRVWIIRQILVTISIMAHLLQISHIFNEWRAEKFIWGASMKQILNWYSMMLAKTGPTIFNRSKWHMLIILFSLFSVDHFFPFISTPSGQLLYLHITIIHYLSPAHFAIFTDR